MSNYLRKSLNKFAGDVLAKLIYDIVKGALILLIVFIAGQFLPENTTLGSFFKRHINFSIAGFSLVMLTCVLFTFLISFSVFRKKILRIQSDNHTDELTGLFNQKALKEKIIQLTAEAKKSSKLLSIIIIDIDDFKSFNVKHGYPVADEILVKLGQILKNDSRITDITFRQYLKGDEFIILASETDLTGATIAANRKRNMIGSTAFTVTGSTAPFHITVSCGVTTFNQTADTVDSLLNRATDAMKAAKSHPNKNNTQALV